MLDLRYIRENKDEVRNNIKNRRLHIDIDRFFELDEKRKSLITSVEDYRKTRNELSKEIPSLQDEARNDAVLRVKEIKEDLQKLDEELSCVQNEFDEIHRSIPNISSLDVPHGDSDEQNVEIKRVGEIPNIANPKDHQELMENLGGIDFERASKVVGSKFYFLKNDIVLLDMAIKQFVLGVLMEEGFSPIKVPALAKKEVLDGAGFNPRGEEKQIYNVEDSDLSMIATSEISIGGFLADETLDISELPLKYAGISECYRTEAGNYGRYSKGLYRVHHFDKVEMFIFCTPEDSPKMHEYLLEMEEKIFTALGIPYRVVNICDGDLGAVAYKKYDVEAWMPTRGEDGDYGEVTSCSNCTDYQARRLKIKYKKEDGSTHFLHTLNGTAIALSRGLIAIIENYQEEDGRVKIPEVLRPYLGGREYLLSKGKK